MSDEIMEEAATGAVEQETVEAQDVKTFTQEEVDRIVADRISRQQRQFDKKLEGIDLNEVRDLLGQREQAQMEEQKQRGDYESLIKEMSDKHNQKEAALKSQLETTLVDGALLTAASRLNAVSPDQVSALLRSSVTLSEDNTVEVFDKNGTPRYNDSGNLLSVNELVAEFLTANPHFVKASAGGSGSSGAAGGSTSKPLSYSDMLEKGDEGMRLFREQKMREAAR
jgi:hypothetical protein